MTDPLPDTIVPYGHPKYDAQVAQLKEEMGGGKKSKGGKRNKYGAQRCELDGYVFASKVERRRYLWWKDEMEAGRIEMLVCHPRVTLYADQQFTLDFLVQYPDGRWMWEDVKGGATKGLADFRYKRKVFDADYPGDPLSVVEEHTNYTTGRKEWRNV